MKLALLAALFVLHPSSFLLAQGSLTPPGAPAPTMKTLDQVEPRTPISSVPFTISTPGSYYLTGNLTVGTAGGTAITINADQVTLDLNGFTISSTASPAAGSAVLMTGTRQSITVRNGQIRGTTTFSGGAFTTGGFLSGVALTSLASNLRVLDLNTLGMAGDGINLSFITTPSLVVERCNATICAGVGIQAALVRECAANTTGSYAIFADVAMNCSGETVNTIVATAAGVYGGSIVESCRGVSVGGFGVYGIDVINSRGTSSSGIGLNGTNATNCYGVSTGGIGLNATNATNCYGSSTTGTGLNATNATNCYGSSTTGPAGLDANPGTASFCRGQRNGGIAITAGIAIGCSVATGTVSSANKFLGTP